MLGLAPPSHASTPAAEFKYDGVRSQIHLLDGGEVSTEACMRGGLRARRAHAPSQIKLFTKNLEDVTTRFPDVVEAVRGALGGASSRLIIDAEIVAVDRSDNGNR